MRVVPSCNWLYSSHLNAWDCLCLMWIGSGTCLKEVYRNCLQHHIDIIHGVAWMPPHDVMIWTDYILKVRYSWCSRYMNWMLYCADKGLVFYKGSSWRATVLDFRFVALNKTIRNTLICGWDLAYHGTKWHPLWWDRTDHLASPTKRLTRILPVGKVSAWKLWLLALNGWQQEWRPWQLPPKATQPKRPDTAYWWKGDNAYDTWSWT